MSVAQELYEQRQKRILDAIALNKPDQVPIVTMWDFFPAKWKGYTVKEVMYNPQLMFDLWVECMLHFKPDLADNPYPLRGFGPLLEILDFQHNICSPAIPVPHRSPKETVSNDPVLQAIL